MLKFFTFNAKGEQVSTFQTQGGVDDIADISAFVTRHSEVAKLQVVADVKQEQEEGQA